MARMYPGKPVVNLSLCGIPKGEDAVFEILKKYLPDEWIVMHSVRENRGDINYEADFVLLIPRKGILVLEVKAHQNIQIRDGVWQEYHADDRSWHDMAKNTPLEQAFLACKQFIKARKQDGSVTEEGKGYFFPKLRYCCAAILVNMVKLDDEALQRDRQQLPFAPEQHYICGLQNLEGLGRSGELARLFESYFGDRWDSDEFDENVMQRMRYEVKPCLTLEADPELYRRHLEIAARRATVLLEATAESSVDVMVSGCAGSGKTVMLLREAERLYREAVRADAPLSILIVCYNRALAEHLKKQFSNLPTNDKRKIEVDSFHSFALKRLRRFDPSWGDFSCATKRYGQSQVWAEVAKQFQNTLFEHVGKHGSTPESFDHIFIDEAQDFDPMWLSALSTYCRPEEPEQGNSGGRVYYFCDVNQTLYKGREAALDVPMKIHLRHNLRNARSIALFNSRCLIRDGIQEKDLPVPLESLDGRTVSIFEEFDVATRRQKISELVQQLIGNEGVNPSDIAILSPYKEGNANNAFPKVDGRIRRSTIRSFKGLEADYVILTDCAPQDTKTTDNVQSFEDFYVAASRAKFALYILPAPGGREPLEQWSQEAEAEANRAKDDSWDE